MTKIVKRFTNSWILLLVVTQVATAQILVNTIVIPPVNRTVRQIFSQAAGGVRVTIISPVTDSLLVNDPNTNYPRIWVSCRLQCLSPVPFTIGLKKDDANFRSYVNLSPGQPHFLTQPELARAFGDFDSTKLDFDGITPAILNGNLPDGI